MSAIGINVTTNDRTYTWADLRRVSRKRTKLEQDYQDAKDEAERLWKDYNSEVDFGEARLEALATTEPVEYDSFKEIYLDRLNELEMAAVMAERTQHRLWNYLNCAHEFDDYPTNEPDNVTMICRKCGLKE